MQSRAGSTPTTADVGLSELELSDATLLLGERAALREYFDEINVRRLRILLWLLTSALAVYSMVRFLTGDTIVGAVAGFGIVADLMLLRGLAQPWLMRSVRQAAAGVLIGHLVLFQLLHGSTSGGIAIWFVVLPIAATRFRLAPAETVAFFASLYSVVAVRVIGEGLITRQPLQLWTLLGIGAWYGALMALTLWISRRRARRFLERWRRESARHSDRLRMKQELEYAREIQLSMLPRSAPALEQLDVAALSLPASEVGGDYYDYFQLGARRLAAVVGDVTGHGVASGLVLSGVRSSLNLLEEELIHPRSVLARVNRMLKRTSAPRMLMTLGLAVVDLANGRLRVATAGHPPPLLRRARGGEIEEVGHGSLPLGALLATDYTEQEVELHSDDVLLLYSDGLVEALNPEGEPYGWDRLRTVLAEAEGTAAEIRDLILSNLDSYRDHAPQMDDVTVLVMRYVG